MKKLFLILVLTAFAINANANANVSDVTHLYLGKVIFKPVVEVSGNYSQGYLQNLAIINHSAKAITMEVISFEFYENGKLIYEEVLHAEAIFKEANKFSKYTKQGIIEDYGLASDVMQAVKGSKVSVSRVMGSNEVLMFSKKNFNVKGKPNKIIVKAKGYNEDLELVNMEYVINI